MTAMMDDETYLKSRTTYHRNHSTKQETYKFRPDHLAGPLGAVVDYLTGLVEEYGQDAVLDWDEGYWEGDDGEFVIAYSRPLSDKEAARRATSELRDRVRERERRAKREAREREEYERLRAKFDAGDDR